MSFFVNNKNQKNKINNYNLDKLQPFFFTKLDINLIYLILSFLLFSIIMVYSSSVAIAGSAKFTNINHDYFIKKHLLWILISFISVIIIYKIPIKFWQKSNFYLIGITIFLLILVLIPGISSLINNSRRWLSFGFINFQVSELAKLSILIYISDYVNRRIKMVQNDFFNAIKAPIIIATIISFLIYLEPDLGTCLIIFIITLIVLYLGGINTKILILIFVLFFIIGCLLIYNSPWRFERFLAFQNPWDEKYVLDKGYQLTHALIAIGRGELFGVGLGNSVEKLLWLPEAHTDFIFSIIAEELGFFGVSILIIMYYLLLRKIINIGRDAIIRNKIFAGLLTQGIGFYLIIQAIINMAVNLGLLPTKGFPLPFISYGGSFMLINLIMMGIILRVDYENKTLINNDKE